MKAFVQDFEHNKLEHLIQTGVTDNEDGTVDPAHLVDRACMDLLHLQALIYEEEQSVKREMEIKGQFERELRDVACQGLVKTNKKKAQQMEDSSSK